MSNWSSVLISDDEDISPDNKVVTRVKRERKAKTNSKINASLLLISDDEDDDYQPNGSKITSRIKVEKTAKTTSKSGKGKLKNIISDDDDDHPKVKVTKIKMERTTKTTSKIGVGKLENMISGDEDDDDDDDQPKVKASNRKPLKRKINNEDYDLKPNSSTEANKPKVKKSKTDYTVPSIDNDTDSKTFWKDHDLLAESMNLNKNVAKNVIKLLLDGNTIPFIARYRREATENMSPEVLREVKSAFEDICELKQKITTVVSTLQKTENLTEHLERAVKSVKSLEELDIIYAPFKPEGKRSLAERARAIGLEQPAIELLLNSARVNLNNYVNSSTEELNNVANIEKGICHIIAQKIATDSEILSFLRDMKKQANCTVETKRHRTKTAGNATSQKIKTIGEKPVDESKFQNYFDFRTSVRHIKPHQVLAINRGEHHKILSVKIVVPDFVFNKFNQFCFEKWVNRGNFDHNRKRILEEAITDSYTRLVHPFIMREIRSELKTMAEKASYDVFSKNLKQLLLAAPIKGQAILGIDPGYAHGCKIAVISSMGTVLDHGVIYPHSNVNKKESAIKLKQMLETHNCSLIALGDATASKETEAWLTNLIKDKYFYPKEVKYTIVSEDGASIYSCSPEAKKEFDDMDTNIISAVSLARRIQDPMAELVKVEPKHLGVGMYQHDLKKKTLEDALNEVVSECVSFVGVDLNTASQALLRRIAGLTEKRASEIIKYRENKGPFVARIQLKEVSGIGPKAFEQCAGFLRVGPTNASSIKDFYKNPKTTKLDQTYIHPESYDIATNLLKMLKLKIDEIGEQNFINRIRSAQSEFRQLQEKLNASRETLSLILEAYSKPLNYDLRTEVSQTAYFTTGLKDLNDLNVGSKVMGRVKNVTHFGCFVDIGMGKDALIHSSKLKTIDLQVGDRMEGVVCMLDLERGRINVEPTAKL